MAIPLAVLASIPALAKTGLGIAQAVKSSKLNPQRPTYEVPQANRSARAVSMLSMVDNNFAGQQNAEDRVRRSTADAIGQLQNTPNASSLLPALIASQNDSLNQLSEVALNDNNRATSQFINNENFFGSLEDQAFQINEMEPYEQLAASKRALMESGIENIYGGIDDISTNLLSNMMLSDASGINDVEGISFSDFLKVNKNKKPTSAVESSEALDIYEGMYGYDPLTKEYINP